MTRFVHSGCSHSPRFQHFRSPHKRFPIEDPVLRRLWSLGIDSSQVYELAQPLLDSIGPRLTGSPAIRSGNDWLVARYREWGITGEERAVRYLARMATGDHALRPAVAAGAHARGDDARVERADQGQGRGQGHHPPRCRRQRGVPRVAPGSEGQLRARVVSPADLPARFQLQAERAAGHMGQPSGDPQARPRGMGGACAAHRRRERRCARRRRWPMPAPPAS